MVTAYDTPTAQLLEEAGIQLILVGDSVGNVILGHHTTIPVTLDMMIHHTRAVVRGVNNAFVVADVPFLETRDTEHLFLAAQQLMQVAGAHALKVECPHNGMVSRIADLVREGIPIMGHLGLVPQHYHALGGYPRQGTTSETANEILSLAHALVEAGIFALVLESIPSELAQRITDSVNIPTIGIGAGNACDGQVQVFHDLVGFTAKPPKHAYVLGNTRETMLSAIKAFTSPQTYEHTKGQCHDT